MFVTRYAVRFADVDNAGIFYYPRFFNAFHVAFEQWWEEDVGRPYHVITGTDKIGFPAVNIVCDFKRPVTFGDIAVLADKTTKLPLLFRALERFGVPYAARGSTLFAREPVVRQLILGMRAIADRTDGVAQAALRRPPFFRLRFRNSP